MVAYDSAAIAVHARLALFPYLGYTFFVSLEQGFVDYLREVLHRGVGAVRYIADELLDHSAPCYLLNDLRLVHFTIIGQKPLVGS